jgi:hypothetical protein
MINERKCNRDNRSISSVQFTRIRGKAANDDNLPRSNRRVWPSSWPQRLCPAIRTIPQRFQVEARHINARKIKHFVPVSYMVEFEMLLPYLKPIPRPLLLRIS